MKPLFASILIACAIAPQAAPAGAEAAHAAAPSPDYAAVLSGAQRSDANRARDQYRHPAETLAFFGLRPDMTVVEIWPSSGWYTEILAPILAGHGKLYAAHNNPAASERSAASVQRFRDKLATSDVYRSVEVTSFGKNHYDSIAPLGSADMLLTFRNVHNMYIDDMAPQAFAAFHAVLKPGGILGIVDHRLPEDRPDDTMTSSGYMKRSTVIALAEAAGFRFVGESDVNANPKDTADYPKGVWTLPPRFIEDDSDRAKYAAIGESDRMTLKFVKP